MLQGYVDDSGSDEQSNAFVLAGFMMNATQWAAFSDDWDAQLRRTPNIDYFKMSEAISRNGEFLGWPREFILCKVKDLLSVIEDHRPVGIGSYLFWPEFAKYMHPYSELKPYALLFGAIFESIEKHQIVEGIFPEAIDVDFDDQGSAGQFALQVYPRFKQVSRPETQRMLGRMPLMLDDKKVLPLQAADMLAWNIRRKLDGEAEWRWLYDRLEPFFSNAIGFRQQSYGVLISERKRRLGF